MKLKKLTLNESEQIASIIDNEGFWYALTEGYLAPEDILIDTNEIDRIKKAINIVIEFRDICPEV